MSKKLLMHPHENDPKYINISIKEEDKGISNENHEKNNDSLDVKIHEKKTDERQTQSSDNQNNSYSLIAINQENSEIATKINNPKKRKKKLMKRNYFNNICKRKSIIAIILNIIFWLWFTFYVLDYKRILIFPRGSLEDRKVLMIYSHTNSDSVIGQIFMTLFYTIFNYYIVSIYPEVILFISYLTYVIYTIFNTECDKFQANKIFLSKRIYLILVFLSFGEVYKLFARKYLDI